MTPLPANAIKSYSNYELEVALRHLRVGCWLVMVLMPLGIALDYFVYQEHLVEFLKLRLICSLLTFGIWILLRSELGRRFHHVLGLILALLPAFFISWMIFATGDPASPYYAGLNLILLAIAFVLRWDVWVSSLAVTIVVAMYLVAVLAHGLIRNFGGIFNSLYFLLLTGIIVITGSRIHRQLRIREFQLRFELEKSRQELEETNRKLIELDQVKSRFFANISHELRTPLTLLIAPLEALRHRFGVSFDDPTRQLLATMHSNGMRLLKLINDLLDLVRLESGVMQVKREAVPMADFLRGLASAARQVADDKRILLEAMVADDVGTIMVDRDKLEKAILNLQFNALKFTPAGGRVTIRAKREGELVAFQVEDTGMGISEKNLPHVFDRFWQADTSSRRKYQGVGIGLALVKELTEVQGGTVTVQSQEGKGTTFTIRLPYLKPDAATPAQPTDDSAPAAPAPILAAGTVSNQEWLANLYRRAELFPSMTAVHDAVKPVETSRNGTHPKVLIADDEPDMLRFLKSQLQEHYQVLEAVDGQQAIEKANQFLPDIILLDMMMPEKDGLQACREIRERTSTRSIPIVLITARADEETKFAALSAGASDFLPKPFSTAELHVRVRNLVESYHYQRKLAKQNIALENTIEQLKETETQLVQTEKLASLGRLSAGIIHEINNPLNFATTGLYTLRSKGKLLAPAQRSEYEEILKDVEEGLGRVKSIVADLRSFSHHENEHRDQLDMAEVVNTALRFTSHEWREKVQVETHLPAGQTVFANKNKLIQVLVNLLQNSLDALQKTSFSDELPTIRITGECKGNRSVITIRDNGKGIEPQNLDKIFDPFFTTKEVGEGMGLGLSICFRIMQEHGGQITVQSEPGHFCEFRLELPATMESGAQN